MGNYVVKDRWLEMMVVRAVQAYNRIYQKEPAKLKIEVTNDMEGIYRALSECAYVCQEDTDIDHLNCLCMMMIPIALDGTFIAVINRNYMLDCLEGETTDGYDILGQELAGVYDLLEYAEISQSGDFSEILMQDSIYNSMYRHWEAYHARYMGCLFLWNYLMAGRCDDGLWQEVIQYFFPQTVEEIELAVMLDNDEMVLRVMSSLGKISFWKQVFKKRFPYRQIHEILGRHIWIEQLYVFFSEYENLTDVYRHFDELHIILRNRTD